MPQVSLYLDDQTDAKARAAAEAAGMSYSRWVADLIREHTLDEWPTEIRALLGSAAAFPDADVLRSTLPADSPRETLD